MRHFYKVIEYKKEYNSHLCQESDTNFKHYIDLTCDADLGVTNESLIGKIISVSHLQPYISLGIDVKVEDK